MLHRTRMMGLSWRLGSIIAPMVIAVGFIVSCSSSSLTPPLVPTVVSTLTAEPLTSTTSPSATVVMATPTLVFATPSASAIPPHVTAETIIELCDPEKARATIVAFIEAHNAGDQERLASLFPTEAYPYAPLPRPGRVWISSSSEGSVWERSAPVACPNLWRISAIATPPGSSSRFRI